MWYRFFLCAILMFFIPGCSLYLNISLTAPQPQPTYHQQSVTPQPNNTIIVEAEKPAPVVLTPATETEMIDAVDEALKKDILRK